MRNDIRASLDEVDQAGLPIALFNVVVGLIFDALVREFPIWRRVTPGRLGETFRTLTDVSEGGETLPTGVVREPGSTSMLRSNIPIQLYIDETVDWLVAEGFLLERSEVVERGKVFGQDYEMLAKEYTLSARTLEVLNRRMPGLQASYANQLGDAARASGAEAGKAAIGEIVGQIIGAATRSVAGMG
jgi:hypothetical protein